MSAAILLKNEVLKARKRVAFWVTLGLFSFIVGATTLDRVRAAMSDSDRPFSIPEAWPAILGDPSQFGPFFFAVLVILLFASEFTWRTARQNVIDGLSKEQFYLGKLLVLGTLVLLFLVIPVVFGSVGAAVGPGDGSSALVRSTDLFMMAGYITVFMIWGSLAFLLAAVVRASGPAMGILFVYIPVEQLVSGLLGQVEALRAVLQYLPFQVMQALTDSRRYYPERLARANAERVEEGAAPLVLDDTGFLFVLAWAYVIAFFAVAFWDLRRRDL